MGELMVYSFFGVVFAASFFSHRKILSRAQVQRGIKADHTTIFKLVVGGFTLIVLVLAIDKYRYDNVMNPYRKDDDGQHNH